MAIARVATTSVASGNRTNTTVSAPAGATTSDVIVVALLVGRSASTTVTAPSGWTAIGPISHSASDPYVVNNYLYYRVHDGSASWTWTHVAADTNAVAAAYSGVDLANILDVAAVTNTTGTGTVAAGTDATVSTITVAAGARLVGMRGAWDGNPISPPGSWTELYDQPVMWFGDRDFTAGGATGTIAIDDGNNTPTTNNRWSIIVAALRPSSGGITYTKTPADPVGVTDNVSAVLAGNNTQTPADPVGVTDTVAAARGLVVNIADGIGVTDTGSPYLIVISETIPENIGVTDSLSVTRSRTVTVADGVGVTDVPAAAKAGDTTSTPTDGVGATDGVTTALAAVRTPSDAAGITDVTSIAIAANRPASDALPLTDSVTATVALARPIADTTGISDQVTAELAGAGATMLADPVAVGDTVQIVQTRALGRVDPVGISDAVSVALSRVVTVADLLGLADGATAASSTDTGFQGRILSARLDIPEASARLSIPQATGDLA